MSAVSDDIVTVGDAARLLDCPEHRVRRTVDQLWPEVKRVGRARVIPRSSLLELAAAINHRFGPRVEVAK